MLEINHSVTINQNTLQNTTMTVEHDHPSDSDVDQMNSFGNLFGGENNMEMLTLLLELIMQLIQDLGIVDNETPPNSDEGNPFEELLKRNLFMSLLTDSSFDAGPSYELFGDEDESAYA